MRVTAAFFRLLDLPGVWVKKVRFEPGRVVVWVALRRKRLCCPKCSYSTMARENVQDHDSVWRHVDLGLWRLEVRARLRRLRCPEHGVHVEGVPFARDGARFTRDLEDLVAWLMTKTDRTAVCRLVRIDWETAGRIIKRVGDELLPVDRLQALFEISLDEVAWRKGHRYLTLAGDHRQGCVVCAPKARVRPPLISSRGARPRACQSLLPAAPTGQAAAPGARARDHVPIRLMPDRPRRLRHPGRLASGRQRAPPATGRARLEADRGLDRHDRRLRSLGAPARPPGRDRDRQLPRHGARDQGTGRSPPRALERAARSRRQRHRQGVQGRPLVAAEEPRAPHRPPGRDPRRPADRGRKGAPRLGAQGDSP